MQLAHRPSKVLVTGRSGTGKSTFWSAHLVKTPAHLKFVFDHEGEFSHRAGVRPATTTQELAAATWSGPWVIYDPYRMFPGELDQAFAFFSAFAFETSTRMPGRKLFACDELQKMVGTSEVPAEFRTVLETGRRYGLDAVMISQAPNLIHNRVRNQLTEIVTFAHLDPRAVEWLECAGFDSDRVRALRPGQYMARDLVSGTWREGRVF